MKNKLAYSVGNRKIERMTYSGWLAFPGFLIFLVIFVIPTLSSFYFGFCKWNLHTTTFTGLDNFKQFFTLFNTKDAIGNTVVFTFWESMIKVVGGLILAVWLTSGIKTAGYMKQVLFIPSLLGSVVIAAAWSSVLEPSGILNQLLGLFGVKPVKWLTSHQWAMTSCIFVDVWKGIGTTLVIYIGGLTSIPKSYYEAAAIDGANGVQRFFNVTLPLMVPSINTVLTLTLISGFRDYALIYSLTGGGPGYATEVLGSAVYKLFSNGVYGLATTGYLIIFLVACCIVLPINNLVAKREAEL